MMMMMMMMMMMDVDDDDVDDDDDADDFAAAAAAASAADDDDDDNDDNDDAVMMLLLLIPPCTFWPAGPLLGVSPLNRASRPPAADVAPPPENLVIYGVFCSSKKNGIDREKKNLGTPLLQHSAEMGQDEPRDGPTEAQHGSKMPQDSPTWA